MKTLLIAALAGVCLFAASGASARTSVQSCVVKCNHKWAKPIETCEDELHQAAKTRNARQAHRWEECVTQDQTQMKTCREQCR